jgi:hypothetical protein
MSFVPVEALLPHTFVGAESRHRKFCSLELSSFRAYSEHLSSSHPEWVLLWLDSIGYPRENG